jgi:hypothetical protein
MDGGPGEAQVPAEAAADGGTGGSPAEDVVTPTPDGSSSDGSSSDGSTNGDAPPPDDGPVMPPSDGNTCAPVVEEHAIEGFDHINPPCQPTSYATNPPSSGNHYGYWANFTTYDFPLPAGFWVHDLEHGAVVITYNCPDGCAADMARIKAWVEALPADPGCASFTAKRKVVVTPYPALTVKFAASSWGWTLRSSCFDETAFSAFYMAHYDKGREPYCNDGVDVSSTTCP